MPNKSNQRMSYAQPPLKPMFGKDNNTIIWNVTPFVVDFKKRRVQTE
jgi:hypothetical protein